MCSPPRAAGEIWCPLICYRYVEIPRQVQCMGVAKWRNFSKWKCSKMKDFFCSKMMSSTVLEAGYYFSEKLDYRTLFFSKFKLVPKIGHYSMVTNFHTACTSCLKSGLQKSIKISGYLPFWSNLLDERILKNWVGLLLIRAIFGI